MILWPLFFKKLASLFIICYFSEQSELLPISPTSYITTGPFHQIFLFWKNNFQKCLFPWKGAQAGLTCMFNAFILINTFSFLTEKILKYCNKNHLGTQVFPTKSMFWCFNANWSRSNILQAHTYTKVHKHLQPEPEPEK